MLSTPQFTIARDGTSLAYSVQGEGDLAIVCTNGYATSDFYWKHVARRFRDDARIITWDLKGHGRSGPAHDLSDCTIEGCVDDLRRVLDAAEVEHAVMVGFSLGCQIILESWRHIPDRISAFVPIFGTYGRPFDALIHPSFGRLAYRLFKKVAPPISGKAIRAVHRSMNTPFSHYTNQLTGMIGRSVDRNTMQPFYDHFEDMDGPSWAALGIAAQEHSAGDLLNSIDVPTLIVAGGRDLLTPQHLSLEMRDRIRNSNLLMIPDATHAGLFEHPELINSHLEHFLTQNGFVGH